MAFNITVPVFVLASNLPKDYQYNFIGLLLFSIAAAIWSGRTTVYCIVVVPTFMVSSVLALFLEDQETTTTSSAVSLAVFCLAISTALAIFKVNICMSVCMHRYASHAAFKCGPITQIGLAILGCLANQGGPIWWASQHQCHHKHCDRPGDPHSPIISGTENAFGFFQVHDTVLEEFVPAHMDSPLIRIIDTWAFTFVSLELWLSYIFLGAPGLFVAYTSGWLCQTITLWFNVANHPPPTKEKKASAAAAAASGKDAFNADCNALDNNVMDPWNDPCMKGVYLPFVLLNALIPVFGALVMEREHGYHHDKPRLAKDRKSVV